MRPVITSEGIILQSIPLKERDRILTLFTPQGVLKIYVKGRSVKTPALIAPLTIAEFLFVQGRSDLFQYQDASIMDLNLKVRDKFESLQAAEKLFQAVLKSQLPGKPAPELYLLLCRFIKQLGLIEEPEKLIAPFLLKLLKHEGVLELNFSCSICRKTAASRLCSACYCSSHTPPGALDFSSEEENLLQYLARCRSLEEISSLPRDQDFQLKITALFHQNLAW